MKPKSENQSGAVQLSQAAVDRGDQCHDRRFGNRLAFADAEQLFTIGFLGQNVRGRTTARTGFHRMLGIVLDVVGQTERFGQRVYAGVQRSIAVRFNSMLFALEREHESVSF